MRKIIDKLLIIVCCCALCGRSELAVISVLISVTVSALCNFTGRTRISLAAELLYVILCVIQPVFLMSMPLVVYDIAEDKRLVPAIGAVVAFISGAAESGFQRSAIILIFSAAVCVLQSRTSSLEQLYQNYIKTVDTSSEVNRLLRDNNLRLIENQNYEIRLATLNERNRIAREIHDNVGHLLSRSILQVQALKFIDDPELHNAGLTTLGESLGSAMTSIRQSVHNLHDDSIDLDVSFRDLIFPLKEKGIAAEYECQYTDVPNNVKICIIGILKEGISNMIRHSKADRAQILFREHPGFYQLMIRDNGECSGDISGSGMGLSNMKARADELGGIINITAEKSGFRIFVTIPKGGRNQ